MKICEYMNTDWFKGLQREVANSTKTSVAAKLGIDRSTLSCVMNGIGEYGKGTSKTEQIAKRYRRTFEKVECPFNGAAVRIEFCRESALCSVPTHNPRQMMQWQACQNCKFKPAPIAQVEVPKQAKAVKALPEPVQQAGIIDKVTLPLPEVGGPQIAEQTNQEAA